MPITLRTRLGLLGGGALLVAAAAPASVATAAAHPAPGAVIPLPPPPSPGPGHSTGIDPLPGVTRVHPVTRAGSPWQPLANSPSFNPGAMILLTDGTVLVQN